MLVLSLLFLMYAVTAAVEDGLVGPLSDLVRVFLGSDLLTRAESKPYFGRKNISGS